MRVSLASLRLLCPKSFPPICFASSYHHPVPVLKHNTGIQLSAICSSHLFLLKLIRFAFGLPVSACWTWDCLSSRQRSTVLLQPSSHHLPRVQTQKGCPESQQRLTSRREFLEYTDWFNRKQSPLQQDGSAPHSSAEKASALTQTLKLWGEGTPYST